MMRGVLPECPKAAGPLPDSQAFAGILTRSPGMRQVFSYCRCVARSQEPVLVTGETGTGKELLAQALHRLSGNPGPFVAVNLAGLDDSAFSDTLFGHVRGAFTGAASARAGLISQAEGGTLFLDEIGELNHASQIKLLRVLQERDYLPLGSDTRKKAQVKLVAATNRDIHVLRDRGLFREDFYYRIRTHHVRLPPLRERREDLPLLMEIFAAQAAHHFCKPTPGIAPEVYARLAGHRFPGNVRELRAMLFDAVARAADTLRPEHFAEFLDPTRIPPAAPSSRPLSFAEMLRNLAILPPLRQAADALVTEALLRANGSHRAAAALLGFTRQALEKRLTRRMRARPPSPESD